MTVVAAWLPDDDCRDFSTATKIRSANVLPDHHHYWWYALVLRMAVDWFDVDDVVVAAVVDWTADGCCCCIDLVVGNSEPRMKQ